MPARVGDVLSPQATSRNDLAVIAVEDLRGIQAAENVEGLQSAIWGSDQTWVVPSHLLHIVSDHGGLLLGAYVDEQLVGFVFGLLARKDEKLLHASHMLGIIPKFQGRGIGESLKLRQKARALEQGLNLMTWTFDPLESRNGHFNLHKLGAASGTYRPNYYGAMRDHLNEGLPSDRLLVEWDLSNGLRPETHVGPPLPILSDVGLPVLDIPDHDPKRSLAIAAPRDIQAIRRDTPELALAWRKATRQAFSWAFERGYVARDFDQGAYIMFPSRSFLR